MANTTSIVGRLKLIHADIGYDGGPALEAIVKGTYAKIGDNIGSRFHVMLDLADSSSIILEHNFKCAFSELKTILYAYDEPTGNLTRLVSGGSPDLDDFVVEADPSLPLVNIRVANNSGSEQDLALAVFQSKGSENLDDLSDVDTAGKEDGQALVFEQSSGKFKPGPSGDSSLKLQSVSGTDLVIKTGFIILSDGRELRLAADLSYDLSGITVDGDYYVYIDLSLLPSATFLDGRKVYELASGMFAVLSSTADEADRKRYAYIGTVQRASGVWQKNQTGAYRVHDLDHRILETVLLSVTGTTVSPSPNLLNEKSYIVDSSGATGDYVLNLPAGASKSVIEIQVIGTVDQAGYPATPYYAQITPNGTETILIDEQEATDVVLGAAATLLRLSWDSGNDWVASILDRIFQFSYVGGWNTRIVDGSINTPIFNGERILANPTGQLGLLLPSNPYLGWSVKIADFAGVFSGTDYVRITAGFGHTVVGSSFLDLSTANDSIELTYNGSGDWRIF